MNARVERIETFVVTLPRDTPYLGALGPGEAINEQGYFVRRANRTIYPAADRSLVVRITATGGVEGFGETYGLVAPTVPATLIHELIAPLITGRDPFDVQVIWDELYDLMRVRGYQGGFWLDAMAAVDIALWDLCGRVAGLPLCKLLGGRMRESVPAYVSGLPAPTLAERVALARDHVARGWTAIKIHGAVAGGGVEAEIAALRDALGPEVRLMADLHWMFTPAEAARLAARLAAHDPLFLEAPVKPEDVTGLAEVARRSPVPIAAGEEWRHVFDARARIDAGAVAIVQPEMGHTGVTQFMRIARYAEAHHLKIAPHATIGCGLFLAASLHAAATLGGLLIHEYQPSIFDRHADLLDGGMAAAGGAYRLPDGPGLGVRPGERLWAHARAV